MTELRNLAKLIRSKNAGPFLLTVDIMFEDRERFDHVRSSGAIDAATVGTLFGVDPGSVRIYEYEPAFAIKVTFPRRTAVGDPEDNDLFGGQQFGPLADLPIPDPHRA